MKRLLRTLSLVLCLAVVTRPAAAADREAAYRANNLGVALLEQFKFAEAVPQFRNALAAEPGLALARINLALALFYLPDLPAARVEAEAAARLAPTAPQPDFLLALIARIENRDDEAITHLQRVLASDPKDPGANLVLGQVYQQQRKLPEAVAAFRVAVAAEPYNASATYNLGLALTRMGQQEEGAGLLARFQVLRESGYKTSFGNAYLEQGRYAEAVASTGAEPDLVDPAVPAVAFVDASDAAPATSTSAPLLGRAFPGNRPAAVRDAGHSALTLADLDGDGRIGAVVARDGRLHVLRNQSGRLVDATAQSSLGAVAAWASVAGDFDNDGKPDLLVLGPGGLRLFRNQGDARFVDVTAQAQLPAYPYVTVSAAFVDIDHDGDLDIFVVGLADPAATRPKAGKLEFPHDFAPAPNLLLQNNGNGTFTDITARAKVGEPGHGIAVVPTDFDNRRDIDLMVVRTDAPPLLLRNLRDGSFADVARDAGLGGLVGPFLSVAAADVNKDGFTDFCFGRAGLPALLATSDGRLGFKAEPMAAVTGDASALQFVDYDADGLLDLVVATRSGLRVLRNTGAWTDVSATAVPAAFRGVDLAGSGLGIADLDADGDEDLLLADPHGIRKLRNDGGSAHPMLAVRLTGRVTNRGGVGSRLDLRAGSLRQRIETSAATPAVAPADVAFGLGARAGADAIRVQWVSGIVQAETSLPAAPATLEVTELDRKPSSCPFLYAWNGKRFEFITDFLGGGEMGYYLAPDERNAPDPEEYVRIRGDQLRERDGRYVLQVTNELEEVLYMDQFELLAVDHPIRVEVYPDEGMIDPPKPFRLFAASALTAPTAAFDAVGRDVRGALARLDHVYADGFTPLAIRGYSAEHALTLDLAGLPADHTLLLLTGWTDYAFSSDNVAGIQAGLPTQDPALQVETEAGEWQTVIENIGVLVGRPQTLVVDLAGLWRGPSRRVRITTTLQIHWDQVLVGAPSQAPAQPMAVPLVSAELSERGYSTPDDPARPLDYDFSQVSLVAPWKVAPGRYTRLGDVRDLLAATDDLFVVSKPGDALALTFDARALPPAAPGFTRTFLLRGDGFSKEMDINSASPDVVLPLPFHGMRAYPYAAGTAPLRVRELAERAQGWNTRVVARPLPPLELDAPTPKR